MSELTLASMSEILFFNASVPSKTLNSSANSSDNAACKVEMPLSGSSRMSINLTSLLLANLSN
jgi:hypothetical protein